MKTVHIQIASSETKNKFKISVDTSQDWVSEVYFNDAKQLCKLLVGMIPSATLGEVERFLKAYRKNESSRSMDTFVDEYFSTHKPKFK